MMDDGAVSVPVAPLLLLAAGSLGSAAAHGSLTLPRSRNNGSLAWAGLGYSRPGDQHQVARWYTSDTAVPHGAPLLCEPALLTTFAGIHDPCGLTDRAAAFRKPWRSPGAARIIDPCGNACGGGGSGGGDTGCGSLIPGGASRGTQLPPIVLPRPRWARDSIVEVGSAVVQNHGGGWSYRLAPAAGPQTEERFQRGALRFVEDSATLQFTNGTKLPGLPVRHTADRHWTRNPVPPTEGWKLGWTPSGATAQPCGSTAHWHACCNRTSGERCAVPMGPTVACPPCTAELCECPAPRTGFAMPALLGAEGNTEFFALTSLTGTIKPDELTSFWRFSLVERVQIPAALPLGNYTLSWRWDTETGGSPDNKTGQTWLNCADVEIVAAGSPKGKPPSD